MKQYIIPLMLIIMITPVLALNLNAGEQTSFLIETTRELSFDVVGNTSNLTGFIVSQEGNNITLSTDYRYKSDSFTLILFDKQEIVQSVQVGGGGGGSWTKRVAKPDNSTLNDTIYLNNKTLENDIFQEINKTIEPEIIEKKGFFLIRWIKSFWHWLRNI